MNSIVAGCHSVTGNYREKNQDRITCLLERGKKKGFFGVACVCDGIGSFEMSEIAARLITEGVAGWYEDKKCCYAQLSQEELVADLHTTLQELNELIFEYQRERQIRIGSTMSLVLFLGEEYFIFHVGDSRIISVRQEMYQLTNDEVSNISREGKIRSYLANYMGKNKKLWVNRGSGKLQQDEILALGSDGFFKKLSAEDFQELRKARSDRKMNLAAEKLVRRVLERGERDNISCILLKIERSAFFTGKEYRRLP